MGRWHTCSLALAVVTLCTLAFADKGAELPFKDTFEGVTLEPGWTVDTSSGNTVQLRDGGLQIEARLNTFAHVQRVVARDHVTVSALMRPSSPAGVSWSCSVFLYWSAGVWCQLGVIDLGDGRYYVTEATGGKPREVYLQQCDRATPHWLRIELGRNCVRYLTRDTSEDAWKLLRAIRRPPEYAGAPELVVLGKGFGQDDSQYDGPDLDNDYVTPGPMVQAGFDEVRIDRTPASRLRLLPGDCVRQGDPVGEAILARPGDPTYDAVAALYPPLRHVREAVGIKGHPHEVGVTETGSVELGRVTADGQTAPIIGRLIVGEGQTPFGEGPRRPHKRLLGGHLPIVVATWTHEGITYRQTVLGYSEGLSDRAALQAYIHLGATSESGPRRVPVSFRVSPQAAGVAPVEGTLDVPGEGSATWALRVPCPVTPGAVAEEIRPWEANMAVLATRRFWRKQFARGMRLSIPDKRLMDGYRAWLAYNAIDVDRVGEFYEPHDGAGFYEQVYGYSAARYAWVLDLWGRHDDAQAVLCTLINHQSEEGLLDWNFGLTDTGALLIAIAVHYETTGDSEWLRQVAPAAMRSCRWLTEHRAETKGAGPPIAGLIKHRSYCDYAAPVYAYLHNCYCCAGMKRIAGALGQIGLRQEAEAIAAQAAAYGADILASMRASSLKLNGQRVIPLEPDTLRLLKDSAYDSRDYYGLVASTMLECGFPTPHGAEAKAYARFLQTAGGILLGVSEFRGGIDHAYGYGYMEHQLIHGEPERYLLGLYTSLAYGMSRETFSSVECTQIKSGENHMTLPHLYSGTQQLFMLRTMLLREEPGRLILCSAVPRAWSTDGKRIAVRDAPTSFGDTSFRIMSAVNRGLMHVVIDPPGRRPLQEIVLHLRHPEAKPITGVRLVGGQMRSYDGERVIFGATGGPVRLTVQYGATDNGPTLLP